MASVYDILLSQGFVRFPEGDCNVVHAEKAFMGNRALTWVRKKAKDPDFNLQAYLVALTYYKLDLADLKFEENELLYRYRGISLEGIGDEFSKDSDRIFGPFHRPDQTIHSDGTVEGITNSEEPPKGDG